MSDASMITKGGGTYSDVRHKYVGGTIKACVEQMIALSTISIPTDRNTICREQNHYKVIKLRTTWSNFAVNDRWHWWTKCMLTT